MLKSSETKFGNNLFDVAELQLMFDLMSRRTLSLSLSFLFGFATNGKISLRLKEIDCITTNWWTGKSASTMLNGSNACLKEMRQH